METLTNAPGAASAADAGLIKDVTAASFMTDVIEASREAPVIVDLWAPWCGPCRQLGPALEKVVRDAKGKLRLAKVNIDEHPQIAQQFRVQSIPAVFAIADGRVVDGFVGAVPESQVKAFADRLLAGHGGEDEEAAEIAAAIEQAKKLLEAGDAGTAAAIFDQVHQHAPDNLAALGGLARAQIALGKLAEAKALIDAVPQDKQGDAEIAAARSALELAEAAAKSGPLDELKAKVEASPKDHAARFDFANALYAAGRQEEAIEQLLDLFRRDRKWNDEAARKQLVKLFEALGPTHPLVASGRRRLSSLLFS
ncbi:MAG TPA: co-chaperone YbbN [Alphaproteobacteria bacterium]|nr:co-chaperone YbbN [Alphaproteobacteria bacterium]